MLLTIHLKQSSEHRLLFCTIHVTFLIQTTRQLGNPLSPSQQGCTLLNNCVLFTLVKLAFVALLCGNILGFGYRVAFTFRAANTIMQKGCSHLLVSMTPKHWKLMCAFADTITSEYFTFYRLILWGFFLLTYSKSSGMHTYRMLFLLNHVTGLKNGWPSVNNVTSVQSKEMTGQTSDVAVISCWPRPARTPPHPPPKKKSKKRSA